jgi:hypothetical protein
MRTRWFLGTCLLLAGGFFTSAQAQTAEDFHVELGVTFWKPSPDLVIATGGNPAVELVNSFGIEDKQFTGFTLTAKPGRKHRVRFSYVRMDYDKEALVSQTIAFGGQVFNVNIPAATDIDWTLLRLGYEFDFVSNEHVVAGVLAELKHNHVKASITSPAISVAAATDTKAPIPTFGGIGRIYIVPNVVSGTVEISGFKLPEGQELSGNYLDMDIFATVMLGRNFAVQAGYRSVDVEYLVDDDSGDLKMKGPYFGGSVRF